MNIPNILTAARFLLIPAFMYQFIIAGDPIWSVVILLISGATDILDGYIARKYNMITKWGIIFDPVADKLTQISVAFSLAFKGLGIMWVAFAVLVLKELLLVFGGIKLYKKNDVVVPAKWYGKISTLLFYIVFFILIIFNSNNILSQEAKTVIVIIALAFSVLAFVKYTINFFKIQKNFF